MRLRRLAEIISWLTTPVLILTVATFILVLDASASHLIKAFVFIALIISLPLALFSYFYLKKKDVALDPKAKERNYLYFAGVFSSLFATIVFGSQILPDIFWFNLGMVVAVYFGLFFLINRYFDKASFHLGTVAFAVMLLTDKVNTAYALFLLIFPVIIWARLTLKKHTWVEILWGWVIGLVVGLLSWTIAGISG